MDEQAFRLVGREVEVLIERAVGCLHTQTSIENDKPLTQGRNDGTRVG